MPTNSVYCICCMLVYCCLCGRLSLGNRLGTPYTGAAVYRLVPFAVDRIFSPAILSSISGQCSLIGLLAHISFPSIRFDTPRSHLLSHPIHRACRIRLHQVIIVRAPTPTPIPPIFLLIYNPFTFRPPLHPGPDPRSSLLSRHTRTKHQAIISSTSIPSAELPLELWTLITLAPPILPRLCASACSLAGSDLSRGRNEKGREERSSSM